MKSFNEETNKKIESKEETEKRREQFWESRCREEPDYLGCRIYDL